MDTKIENTKKIVLYETELLTDIYRGIHTKTTVYTDGTFEVTKIPKGNIIISNVIFYNKKEL